MTDPKAIWNRYRKQIVNGLWLDVLSLLPFDWLLEAGQQPIWALAFRLTRLIQITQAASYLRSLETSPGVNVLLIRLSKTVIVYLLMAHLEGCAWFAFALPDNFGKHEWLPPAELIEHTYLSQYLRVLYWGLATLSDRIENPNPYTATTTAFMVMTQITGVLLLAYIIGNITFAIDDANETFQRHRLQLDYVQRFMTHTKLPMPMQQRVVRYYDHVWATQRGFDDSLVLKELPPTLATDVCLQLTASTVGCNSLFQGLDQHFLAALVKVLIQRTLVPAEHLIREGEAGDEMFFIRSGILIITVNVHDAPESPAPQAVTPPQQHHEKSQGLLALPSADRYRMMDASDLENTNTPRSTGAPAAASSGPAGASSPSPRPTAWAEDGDGSSTVVARPKLATRQVQTCVDGDLIGEFCVLLADQCPVRTSNAIAVSYCDLFVLRRDDLARLLSFYPTVQAELEARTAKRRQLTLRKEENILGLGLRGAAPAVTSGANTARNVGGVHSPRAGEAPAPPANSKMKGKMQQLLGGAGGGGAQSSSGSAGSPAIANPNAPKSRDGKFLDPDSREYKLEMWLRKNWVSNSLTYQNWSRWIAIISLYNAICIPFRLAFDFSQDHPALLFFDYLLDSFLVLNVVVHFWLREPPKLGNGVLSVVSDNASSGMLGAYEDMSTARWRYIRSGWFFWDAVTATPLDLFMLVHQAMNPWFRIMKLTRFATDVRVLSNANLQSAGLDGSAVGLVRLLTGFILLTHWCSCTYWSFHYWYGYEPSDDNTFWRPRLSFKEQGLMASYLYAQFQTFVLFTGLGQKAAPELVGDPAIAYVIFMILLGILLVAWAIGEVGERIANLDRFSAEFGRQMLATNAFMSYRHFEPKIQKRVRDYLSHWWSTRHGVDPHEALKNLPVGLRSDIMHHLCESQLMKVPLLNKILSREANFSFGRHLIERLKFTSYPSGELIFEAGEIGDSMFFITDGEVGLIVPPAPVPAGGGAVSPVGSTHAIGRRVSVMTHANSSGKTGGGTSSSSGVPAKHTLPQYAVPSKILGVGSFFGEVCLLSPSSGGLRTASIRALKPTFLLVLEKDDLYEIMENHEEFANELRALSTERANKLASLRARGHAARLAAAARRPPRTGGETNTSEVSLSDPGHHFGHGHDEDYGAEVSRSQGAEHFHTRETTEMTLHSLPGVAMAAMTHKHSLLNGTGAGGDAADETSEFEAGLSGTQAGKIVQRQHTHTAHSAGMRVEEDEEELLQGTTQLSDKQTAAMLAPDSADAAAIALRTGAAPPPEPHRDDRTGRSRPTSAKPTAPTFLPRNFEPEDLQSIGNNASASANMLAAATSTGRTGAPLVHESPPITSMHARRATRQSNRVDVNPPSPLMRAESGTRNSPHGPQRSLEKQPSDMSVFAQARRLQANRAVETQVRSGASNESDPDLIQPEQRAAPSQGRRMSGAEINSKLLSSYPSSNAAAKNRSRSPSGADSAPPAVAVASSSLASPSAAKSPTAPAAAVSGSSSSASSSASSASASSTAKSPTLSAASPTTPATAAPTKATPGKNAK